MLYCVGSCFLSILVLLERTYWQSLEAFATTRRRGNRRRGRVSNRLDAMRACSSLFCSALGSRYKLLYGAHSLPIFFWPVYSYTQPYLRFLFPSLLLRRIRSLTLLHPSCWVRSPRHKSVSAQTLVIAAYVHRRSKKLNEQKWPAGGQRLETVANSEILLLCLPKM